MLINALRLAWERAKIMKKLQKCQFLALKSKEKPIGKGKKNCYQLAFILIISTFASPKASYLRVGVP